MGRPEANLRLFVAAYPPPEAVDRMLAALDTMELPRGRRTPAEQVHLTLQFIGDRPIAAMAETIESFRKAASAISAFELVIDGLIMLPERGRPRLIAAEASAPPGAVVELHRRLASRLASEPRSQKGERFLPHLTLMRFDQGSADGSAGLARKTPIAPIVFAVREIALMRSVLRPEGAVHKIVERVALVG